MKKLIKAIWHGIKAVFTAVVEWMATLFGMKEDTKYARVLRKLVATAFAVVVIVWALGMLGRFVRQVSWQFGLDSCFDSGYAYFSEQLSDDIAYYDGCPGYLENASGKKVLKDVWSIAKPLDGDSLVYFSDGEKRGYFHMRDGHVVVEPIYEHAWIFSDGLAAVEENGKVLFINTEGKVVIDKGFAFHYSDDGYVFHNGHCAVNDLMGHNMGLIDRNGEWALQPEYDLILPVDTFWVVTKDGHQAIITFGMDTLFPMNNIKYELSDTSIYASLPDHTLNVYDRQGQLVQKNLIKGVRQLMYETDEFVYPENRSDEYDYEDSEPHGRMAVASCLLYEAESGWYGLMSREGHQLTPPSYCRIEAVGKDLYHCESSYGHGVVLNSQGQRVE